MKYEILNTTSVISYVKNIKEIMTFFNNEQLEVKEIGDGNLNYVYLVNSIKNPKKAVILKQAVPYLRCVGEDFPLSRDRMTFEIRALRKFKNITPDFIPDIYHTSEDMSVLVMQYLDVHNILRGDLIKELTFPNFSNHISTYLANTLFYTSSLALQSDEKRDLISQFNNNKELCKLTEDFVFTFAFMNHEANDNDNVTNNPQATKLFNNMDFKQKVLELKYKFMTQTDALLHGDLHTGSIMLNEIDTYIIDPEFAFVGPFGFDIGALIANLVNNYVHHHIVTRNNHMKEYLLQTIENILIQFNDKFIQLWDKTNNSALLIDNYIDHNTFKAYQEKFMLNILQDSIGFAGCKMARRVFGTAGVDDIRGIKDSFLRNKAESMVLDIATTFVLKYDRITNIEEVIEIIKSKDAN